MFLIKSDDQKKRIFDIFRQMQAIGRIQDEDLFALSIAMNVPCNQDLYVLADYIINALKYRVFDRPPCK